MQAHFVLPDVPHAPLGNLFAARHLQNEMYQLVESEETWCAAAVSTEPSETWEVLGGRGHVAVQ